MGKNNHITSIADLTPDPQNARKHTPRNVGMLEQALHEVGAARSIVVDEHGVVLAGNATIEAAAQAGITRVQVVDADGETLVAVRRTGLTAEQKVKLALYDNRVAELAEWDACVLASLDVDLSGLFFEDELSALLADTALPEPGGGGDEFDTTPQDGPTRTHLGDLWQIGPHRLLVGDCTDATNVARLMGGECPVLMVTDPPYGVEYDPAWRKEAGINNSHGMMGKVENDARVDWKGAYDISGAQVAYVWHAGRHARHVAENLDDAGYDIVAQIIWAKDRFALSRGDYHWQHEPCWYAVAKGKPHNWQGSRNQSTLWEIARLSSNTDDSEEDVWGHGTQKPIECMQRPIENNTALGQLAYDPFLGSGTTLIAAHRTGRRCYGMEISPRYADVILRRAEAEGLTCERITHSDE